MSWVSGGTGSKRSDLLQNLVVRHAGFRGLPLPDQFLCVHYFGGLQLLREEVALSTGLFVTLGGRQRKPQIRLGFVGRYALPPPRVSSPGYVAQGQTLGRPQAATTVRLPYRPSTHPCPPSSCHREHFAQMDRLAWPHVGTIGWPRSCLSAHLGHARTPGLTQTVLQHFPAQPACAAVELARPVRVPAGRRESAGLAPHGEAVHCHTRSSTRASCRRQRSSSTCGPPREA